MFRAVRRSVPILLGAWLLMSGMPQAVKAQEPYEEDEERIRDQWDTAMSPEEYREALRLSGMEDAMRGLGERSADWVPGGPVGGIYTGDGNPLHSFNGRIASIGVRATGGGFDVLAGASSGGLWRAHSQDGVGVWTSLGDNLPNPSVRAFAVDPGVSDDILVGTGDVNRYAGSGMYRTTNGGLNWFTAPLPVNPSSFGRIHWSAANPDRIVACCSPGGVIRSITGGVSWYVALSGDVTDLVVDPSNFDIQYASCSGLGAFKSTDGGATWVNMNVPLPPGVTYGRGFLAVCRDAPSNVALFLAQNDYQVLRSADSGTSWINITGTLGGWHMAEFSHTGAITFRPNDPGEIFVGARGFLKTTDDGATWDTVLDTHADITQLYFGDASGDDFLWICCDGGVIGQHLGGSTEVWNGDDVTGLQCYQLHGLDAKRDIFTIATQDNAVDYSTDDGASWDYTGGGDGLECEIVDDVDLEFWHAYWGGGPVTIYRTRADGSTTFTGNTGEWMDGLFYSRYTNWMYSMGNENLIYGCDVSGSPLQWVIDGSLPEGLNIGRFPIGSYVDGLTLYAGYETAPVVLIARLSGAWNVQTVDLGGGGAVLSAYASTENAGEAWVTMRRDATGLPLIYHTRDYGASWADVTGNLPPLMTVRCLVSKPFEKNVLFIGTDIGVFTTNDGGANWEPFQAGLPIVMCKGMRYVVDPAHAGNDKLVAATFGRGVYERAITSFPLVYVQPSSPSSDDDGTYDHPFKTFTEGQAATPVGGSLALYGGTYDVAPLVLNTPVTLRAYGGTAQIRRGLVVVADSDAAFQRSVVKAGQEVRAPARMRRTRWHDKT